MSTNPFTVLIADAKSREAQKAADAKKAEHAAAEQLAAKREAAQKQAEIQKLLNFGQGFVHAVAGRIARPDWSAQYLQQINEYCAALLRGGPSELPKIAHAPAILEKFEYGLILFEQRHGYPVPDGTFYGQQLVTERAAERAAGAKPEPIVIKPGDRPKGKRPAASSTTNVVELRPATTPPGTGKKGRCGGKDGKTA